MIHAIKKEFGRVQIYLGSRDGPAKVKGNKGLKWVSGKIA